MGEIITLNGKGAKILKPAFKVLGRKKKKKEEKQDWNSHFSKLVRMILHFFH